MEPLGGGHRLVEGILFPFLQQEEEEFLLDELLPLHVDIFPLLGGHVFDAFAEFVFLGEKGLLRDG